MTVAKIEGIPGAYKFSAEEKLEDLIAGKRYDLRKLQQKLRYVDEVAIPKNDASLRAILLKIRSGATEHQVALKKLEDAKAKLANGHKKIVTKISELGQEFDEADLDSREPTKH